MGAKNLSSLTSLTVSACYEGKFRLFWKEYEIYRLAGKALTDKLVPKSAFYSTSQTFCGKQVDLISRKADTINTKYQYRGKTVLLLMSCFLWKNCYGRVWEE